MTCPFCGSEEIIVNNSRKTFKGYSTWRRKKCVHCLNIFTTYEKINLNYIIVEKKDNSKEKYSHYKLYGSIFNSFLKRKNVDTGDCAKEAQEVIKQVEEVIVKKKIKNTSTKELFNITIEALLQKDVRVAMNYLSYSLKDKKVDEIEKMIKYLISKSGYKKGNK